MEDAISAAIVTVLSVIVVSIPSPPVKVKVSDPTETLSVPLSPAMSSEDAAVEEKDKFPEPSVTNTSPLLPSVPGRV